MYKILNSEKALIWRITHFDNLKWILDNGLHSSNSSCQSSDFIPIGNPELIHKRKNRVVPVSPGGTLADYVPFYFTPYSPMLLNVHTGKVQYYPNDKLIFLVTNLHELTKNNIKFLFTDRHAYLAGAKYFSTLEELIQLPWSLWQQRDFRKDPENLEKTDRYQAEALVYKHLPIESLQGIVCYSNEVELFIKRLVELKSLSIKVVVKPNWYFE